MGLTVMLDGCMHACMLPAMCLLRVVKAMLIELSEPFWSLQQFRWFVCLFSWKSPVKHRFLLLSQGTRISCILGPIPMHRAQKCFFITTVLSSVLHGMTNKWDYFLWCNNIFFLIKIFFRHRCVRMTTFLTTCILYIFSQKTAFSKPGIS